MYVEELKEKVVRAKTTPFSQIEKEFNEREYDLLTKEVEYETDILN